MLGKIKTFLAPFINKDGLIVWDDTKIGVGNEWRQEIDNALNETAVAVMLVSADFLASDFIYNVELPAFIKAAESNSIKICWVLISDCLHTQNPYISKIQAVHDISRPLDTFTTPKLHQILTDIVTKIIEQYDLVLEANGKSLDTVKTIITNQETANPVSPIFLSYHHADKEEALRIRDRLKDAGIDAWIAQQTNLKSAQFSIEIEQTIRRSLIVVALITQNAIETNLVRNQVSFALDCNKTIIAVLLQENVKPFINIIDAQSINMFENKNDGLEKLIETVKPLFGTHQEETKNVARESAQSQLRSINQNPFIFGSVIPAELFTERKSALNAISEHVGNYYSLQSMSIVAERRMGKTSLLNFIWKKPDRVFLQDHDYVTVYVDAMDARAHTISGFMRTLRKSLEEKLGKPSWGEKDDGNLTVFTEAIQGIAEENEKRIIFLLDEFENVMAYKEMDILLDTLRSNGSHSKIGMIVATAHELPELEREGDLVSKFSGIFKTHYLGLFSKNESEQLIKRAFERSGKIATDEQINLIIDLSGRHPHLLQIAGSIVWRAEQTQAGTQDIHSEFAHNAKSIFAGIQQRLNSVQLDTVKHLCGIKTRKNISDNILFDLRARGILNEKNDLFSICFADYLRKELRKK